MVIWSGGPLSFGPFFCFVCSSVSVFPRVGGVHRHNDLLVVRTTGFRRTDRRQVMNLLFFFNDLFCFFVATDTLASYLQKLELLVEALPQAISRILGFCFCGVCWRFVSSGLVVFPLLRFPSPLFSLVPGWSGWGFFLPSLASCICFF